MRILEMETFGLTIFADAVNTCERNLCEKESLLET